MNIITINKHLQQVPSSGLVSKRCVESSVVCNENQKQKVFATNFCFRGINTQPLIFRYKNLIEHEKNIPIEALLKLEGTKEELTVFTDKILTDKHLGFDFIDSIVRHPRQIKLYFAKLQEKLSSQSSIFNIYAPNNLYKQAYENYIETRVQNAKSVSELIKIRPDWREEFLLQKHYELYGNREFELGFVPDSIGNENFSIIMDYLKKYNDFGFKIKHEIPDLYVHGKNFSFEKLIDGRSDKNVFLIKAPSGKKYVIKTASQENKGLNKPFSLGACCLVDQYLTRNNCRNSAPLRYYHHNTNTAIYDFIEHEKTEHMVNFKDFKENMPDFEDLGLKHNDTVGVNNYFKLNEKQKAMENSFDFQYGVEHQELVSVDNDHVTYNQFISPMIDKYHTYLPMGMQMFN